MLDWHLCGAILQTYHSLKVFPLQILNFDFSYSENLKIFKKLK